MITTSQATSLLWNYAKSRVIEQIKAVALIISYLLLFQLLVLGMPVADAWVIALGMTLVIFGLTFFMEGLVLGLMPLGEIIGLKLPEKSPVGLILVFAFILGIGATFAEPAIGVLRMAGSSVTPWDAPLLFMLLNQYPQILVYSVGLGVGVAVVLGMLRFLYDWSLKPYVYILVSLSLVLTLYAYQDANLIHLTGLAWDSGAVTTGPVTVPLVLALGIGITRVVSKGAEGESQGFGVVTLASLLPIITVLSLGIGMQSMAPQPMSEQQFFSAARQAQTEKLFADRQAYLQYALEKGSDDSKQLLKQRFPDLIDALPKKSLHKSDFERIHQLFLQSLTTALQAILPLSLFLILMLRFVLRNPLPRPDEVYLGIAFALFGMVIFTLGIHLGLAKLGDQVGGKLPATYKSIQLPEQSLHLFNFDTEVLKTAIDAEGEKRQFFYLNEDGKIRTHFFYPENYDQDHRSYQLIPRLGPLFGKYSEIPGLLVVLLFAFLLGYAATLAEPALNALGSTVEQLTAGSFEKVLLMQSVAVGVGMGLMLGMAKIVWAIPLIWFLLPGYLILLLLTFVSNEEFVNIAWDSAGVTTGPITVPLVLSMGLGVSAQTGVVEGFGILAMASLCPIMSVLIVGVWVSWQQRRLLQRAEEQ